jgi:hypothetical protein
MTQNPSDGPAPLRQLTEDTTGFGEVELRTARDLLLRPHTVLTAWMDGGPSGAGRYARPLRFYLALNGVLMLILFLRGGSGFFFETFPPEFIPALAERADKSVELFMSDVDGWMSLVMVPIICAFYPLIAAPLLRWWDPDDLGWRRALRATFGYLSAWTVPMLPLAWWTYDFGPAGAVASLAIFVLSIVTFLRMGRGRWYATVAAGLGKGLVLCVALYVTSTLAMVPVVAVALAGSVYGP